MYRGEAEAEPLGRPLWLGPRHLLTSPNPLPWRQVHFSGLLKDTEPRAGWAFTPRGAWPQPGHRPSEEVRRFWEPSQALFEHLLSALRKRAEPQGAAGGASGRVEVEGGLTMEVAHKGNSGQCPSRWGWGKDTQVVFTQLGAAVPSPRALGLVCQSHLRAQASAEPDRETGPALRDAQEPAPSQCPAGS